MPKCRKLTAHPAHLALLFHVVNQGEAATISALKTASRVLETLDKAVCPPEDKWVDWVDPVLVRTADEWEHAQKEQPAADNGRVRRWAPSEKRSVLLSEDEYEHARKCFDKSVGRATGASARSLLALHEALEAASAVDV